MYSVELDCSKWPSDVPDESAGDASFQNLVDVTGHNQTWSRRLKNTRRHKLSVNGPEPMRRDVHVWESPNFTSISLENLSI